MNSDWAERSAVTTARGYSLILCNWFTSQLPVTKRSGGMPFFNKKTTVNGPYIISLF